MLMKRRNPAVSSTLESALLLLAIFVFTLGLHAKLALYHTSQGQCSMTNSMAKISAETRAHTVKVSIPEADPADFTLSFERVAVYAFGLQAQPRPAAMRANTDRGPHVPGQYYLHGADLKLRPPPDLS